MYASLGIHVESLSGAYMIAYEFCWRDEFGDAYLVGILPERRKDQARITNESIMNWVKKIVGNSMTHDDIFFSKVNLNEFK